MRDEKAFVLITMILVLAIIGLSVLIGLRFYGINHPENKEDIMVQDKARDAIVQANVQVSQSSIQAGLSRGDISLDEAVKLAQNSGLQDPFSEVAMNKPEWFPQIADSPGEIQINIEGDTFYIQGYGSKGLLDKILTVRK